VDEYSKSSERVQWNSSHTIEELGCNGNDVPMKLKYLTLVE